MWRAFIHLVSYGVMAEYASTSLHMIGFAAFLSLLVGVPVGFAVGVNRYAAHALEGFLRFLQGISGIAWLPLAIIWFGFTHTTTLVIVIYTLIVPIIFNTMIGVRAIPEAYTLALRSLGASPLRLVKDVYLPGALPSIVVGLRLGMGYGWRALIAAEMLVRKGGLGDLIFGARTFGQIDRIITGMIVIGCLYLVVDRLIVQPIENLHHRALGSPAPMSMANAGDRSSARRTLDQVLWRLLPLAPFALVLAAWGACWSILRPPPATLPAVQDVVAAMWELAAKGELATHVAASLWRLLLGALLGVVTGVVGGFIVGLNRSVSEFLSPLIVFFNAISGIVWLPLVISWLGIGTALAVFLIWNTVFFIVFQNTVLGVQLVPQVYEQGVQALGGGRWETIRSVILPGALPYILTGLRSGLGFGWRALIAAELVGATTGLGQMIFGATEYHRSDIIIGGCLIIGTIAIAMDRWLLLPIERRTIERWGLVFDARKEQ